jgi:hypothetical protein
MSAEKKLATPAQARELFDRVIELMDHKGQRYVTGEVLWSGEKITLPAKLRERTKASEEHAQNFHFSSMIPRVTTLNELAVINVTSLNNTNSGLDALRYKIVPLTGLQDLSLECHEIESLLPKIPSDRDAKRLEVEEGHIEPSNFPTEGLDNPQEFGKALFESATLEMFRQEIDRTEREAKARALGEFATSAAEADELMSLVRNFAES